MPTFRSEMSKYFQRKGFRWVSQGTRAVVYQDPETQHVYKAFILDNAYLAFLKLVSNHQNNIHFPKILAHEKLTQSPYEGVHIIKMEHLTEIDDAQADRSVYPYIQYRMKKPVSDRMQEFIEDLKEEYPSWWETLELVDKHVPKNCKLDLNAYNVMRRKGSGLVVIDPYWSQDDD